ncbi:MAG TPA: hypothetical protein VMV29_15720 [Ktedonobacterales bacterium]|nr:hypothetical protein [Ktedonobacterales bacterium]
MSFVDRVLRKLLAPTVNALIQEYMARYYAGEMAGEDPALFHALVYGDKRKLHIDPTAVINDALINLSSGDVTIGKYAFFGHRVSLLTGTHDINTFGAVRQVAVPRTGRDIVIEEGAWLSSNVTVVGPCTIGKHAVVAVGAVVLGDVAPYTVVAGVPATARKVIPHPDEQPDGQPDEHPAQAGARS